MKTIIHYLVAFLSFTLISCGSNMYTKGLAHSNKHLKRVKTERQYASADQRVKKSAKKKDKRENPGQLQVKGVSSKGSKVKAPKPQRSRIFYPIGVNGN